MSDLSFGQPLWFWAFALIPILLVLFWRAEIQRRTLIRQLIAARLETHLAGNVSTRKRRWQFAFTLLGLACIIAALCQPRLGETWQESKRRGRDVLIAIDTSKSMLATDVAPNRLARAKLAAQDLIEKLDGDRVGLIAFAGTAFLQAPLTIDYSAVLASLNELDTEIVPQGGTNLAAAIKTAVDAFGKGESEHRALIIFTDGEDLEAAGENSADQLQGSIRIFTLGLGSPDGSLIPLPNGRGGEFVKDSNGQIVKSRLDEDRLTKIAQITGGFYLRLENGPSAAQRLVQDGLAHMSEQEIDAKVSRQPIERYQWPLSVGLVLLGASMLFGERKNSLKAARGITAALVFIGFWPLEASAKNRGLEAFEREDYPGAVEEFGRQLKLRPNSQALQYSLGSAAYKAGDLETALQAFSQAVTTEDPQLRSKAEYNLGNTLYQRGAAQKETAPKLQEWKNALQHYQQALQSAPENPDAEYNRNLVQKLIEQLEQQPPEQKPDKDKKDKQDKKDPNEKKDPKEKKEQKEQKDGEKEKEDEAKPGQDGKEQDPSSGEEKKDPTGGEDKQKPEKGKEGKDQTGKEQPGEEKDGKDSPPRKREGEIQSKPQFDPKDSPESKEQAEEAQAAAEGKMTEQQAKNLLDSLKGEDQKVQLNPRERRGQARIFRDW